MRLLILLLTGLVLSVAGCGDDSLPAEPPTGTRIISLSPAASVMLRDAGLEDSIVGRHGWDAVLDPSLPVAGDQTGLDYERLLGLAPTHIVIEWGERDLPERLMTLATERSFKVIQIQTLTVEDITASARLIEGTIENSRPIDSSALETRRDPKHDWGSVLLVVAASPTVDCLGPGSAHHQLLEAGGFLSTLDNGSPWVTLELEDAIELNPDCIVLVQPANEPSDSAEEISVRLGPLADANINAIALDRVALITDPLALIPGTNLAAFADELWAKLDAMGPLPSPQDDQDR